MRSWAEPRAHCSLLIVIDRCLKLSLHLNCCTLKTFSSNRITSTFDSEYSMTLRVLKDQTIPFDMSHLLNTDEGTNVALLISFWVCVSKQRAIYLVRPGTSDKTSEVGSRCVMDQSRKPNCFVTFLHSPCAPSVCSLEFELVETAFRTSLKLLRFCLTRLFCLWSQNSTDSAWFGRAACTYVIICTVLQVEVNVWA